MDRRLFKRSPLFVGGGESDRLLPSIRIVLTGRSGDVLGGVLRTGSARPASCSASLGIKSCFRTQGRCGELCSYKKINNQEREEKRQHKQRHSANLRGGGEGTLGAEMVEPGPDNAA